MQRRTVTTLRIDIIYDPITILFNQFCICMDARVTISIRIRSPQWIRSTYPNRKIHRLDRDH